MFMFDYLEHIKIYKPESISICERLEQYGECSLKLHSTGAVQLLPMEARTKAEEERDKLQNVLIDIIDYDAGADSPLEYEYVIDRAKRILGEII